MWERTWTNSWWNSAIILFSLKTSFKVLSQVPKDYVWLEVFFSVFPDLFWSDLRSGHIAESEQTCSVEGGRDPMVLIYEGRGPGMKTQMGKWQKTIISIIITAKETWFSMVNWKQLLMQSNMFVEKSGILNVRFIPKLNRNTNVENVLLSD